VRLQEVLAALALSAGSAIAAPQSILIDFGDPVVLTGARGEVWNDIHTNNQAFSHALVDTTGVAAGITLDFAPSKTFGRVQRFGVTVPAIGSELETLSWPASAISDGLYAGTTPNAPEAIFTLSGLDASATYDIVLLASLIGSPDQVATEYTATGANEGSAVLEGAENDADVVRIEGIVPDGAAEITVRVRTATTNTSRPRDYYLNALQILEHASGTQSPLVRFSINRVGTSRIQQNGVFAGAVELYTNDLTAPTVTLTAVDDATQLAPTWLSLPATGMPGVSVPLSFDPTVVGLGDYTATLTAQSAGYDTGTLVVTLHVRDPGRLNLLYYGNSWSTANGAYPDLVEAMALELGLDLPMSVHRFALGKQMIFHANNAGQIGAISQSLPLGELWDWVLTLTGTYESTAAMGNYPAFESDTLSVVGNVRAHSPNARACLIQPWARAEGHAIYSGQPPTFTSPFALHQEVFAGYEQVIGVVNSTFGAGTALHCRPAEAVMLLAFDPQYYGADMAHPGPRITVITAMNAFASLFGERACDMVVDHVTPSLLSSELTALNFDETDRHWMAGIADRVADTALRRLPGSGEDFLLETGLAGALSACALERRKPGDRLEIRVTSPNGSYDGFAATIHVDVFPKGQAPGPFPPSPELHYDPASSEVVASTSALGAGGLTASVVIERWMVGKSLIVQAVVQAPSARTGNVITATDGHKVRVGHLPSLNAVK
jgi:hypothetical protein